MIILTFFKAKLDMVFWFFARTVNTLRRSMRQKILLMLQRDLDLKARSNIQNS